MKNDEKDGDDAGAVFLLVLLLIGAVWVSYNTYDQTKETNQMVKSIIDGRANIPCNTQNIIRIEDEDEFDKILEGIYEKEAKEI